MHFHILSRRKTEQCQKHKIIVKGKAGQKTVAFAEGLAKRAIYSPIGLIVFYSQLRLCRFDISEQETASRLSFFAIYTVYYTLIAGVIV